MKSRAVIIWCLLAVAALSCESAYQELKSFNDLKKINFGQSVPKHTLLLLHWFANTVNIDNNDVVRLTFNPNTGDFGSHHYGNFEDMLDPLPRGYRYYTVGNRNKHTSDDLPDYVLNPPVMEYERTNMDRIIFRVQEHHSGVHRIDCVYITQHYSPHEHQGTRYNPEHTYQVSINLLRQIRLFSVENQRSLSVLRDQFHSSADDYQLRDIINTWGYNLACVGLMLFIVIQDKYTNDRPVNNRPVNNKPVNNKPVNNTPKSKPKRNTQIDHVVNIPDEWDNSTFFLNSPTQRVQMELEVVIGKKGNAKICWRNVSRYRIDEGVAVVLFKHEMDQEASSFYKLIHTSKGSYDTSVPLNEGLQVRLHKARRQCFFWTKVEEEICRGREFQGLGVVSIPGYNAHLQLFVSDGKACARLYVNKRSFRQWRSEFEQSWVGFYKSADKGTNDYEWMQWQWATNFKQCPDSGDYNVFEYCSGLTVVAGVQARFILKDYTETARTPTWT